MKLHVIGSSSAGNGYVLQTDNKKQSLIMELGCNLNDYYAAIDYKISSIQGAIITHEHRDHALHIGDFAKHGGNVYCTSGTADGADKFAPNLPKLFMHRLNYEWQPIGDFWVKAVKSIHDANEPCNFIIRHFEMGDLLFITDTSDFPYITKNVTNIMVETNFDMDTIDELLTDQSQKSRLMSTHLSVQTAIAAVKRQDLSRCKNIVLIHVSGRHGDSQKFKLMMMKDTNKNVIVAEKGVTVDLNSSVQF